VGLPLGKGLTGLTAGILARALSLGRNRYSSLLAVPTTFLAYVPECLYTIAYFRYLVPYFYGFAMEFMIPIVISKAWVEIIVMSFLMGAIVGNNGFKEFITRFLGVQKQPTKL